GSTNTNSTCCDGCSPGYGHDCKTPPQPPSTRQQGPIRQNRRDPLVSNVETAPAEQTVCTADTTVATEPDTEVLHPREVPLGGPLAMRVRRALPNRDRRMVGAWCFVDSYGPTDITGQQGMQVPPH